jgi:uncharacterized protein (TIGR02246 family)
MSSLTQQDLSAIEQLFAAYGEAWTKGDAAGCAVLFTADGDGFAIDGAILRGPTEIRQYYEQHLPGKYKDLVMSDYQLEPPRALSQDVVLINGSWQLHGFANRDPEVTVPVHATFIVTKTGSAWRYAAVRMMVPFGMA